MFSNKLVAPGAIALAMLSGCASVPFDWGRGQTSQYAADRGRALPQPADAASFTRDLVGRPLTPEAAVQIALVNSPAVRKESARLGLAAADVYEAGRLANPVFSASRLHAGDPSAANAQLTLGIAFNFVNLLFIPANSRYAGAQFEAAKLSVASAAVNLAADVEAAYYEAVGANQLAQMRETVAKSAQGSADLAQRFFDAGNISKRELASEQAAASQAQLDALSAGADAVAARTALNRVMGLSADQDTWQLDARLAEPLPQEDDLAALQQLGAKSRLDIEAARKNAAALSARYGLQRHTRFINNIEVGVEREKDYDGAINVGPTLQFELPLFNWGGGRVAAAQAALDQAEAELDTLVIGSSNDIKLARAKVDATRARIERYRGSLIPQREAVVAQMQGEVNYMLIGIFDLLVAKQQEYDAYAGYLEAVRDYWLARTELTRAVGQRLPSSDQAVNATLDPKELTKPKGGGMGHMHHGGSMSGMEGMSGMEPAGQPAPMGDMPGMNMQGGGDRPMEMPGMKGMQPKGSQSKPAAPSKSAKPAAPHNMKDMPMGDMPGMEGMDHSQSGATAKPPAKPASGHEMKGMEPSAMPDPKKSPEQPVIQEVPHAH
ncbi:MAG: hypothetical protein JWQ90_4614 [Hydrocarboniphaga sp.]|uniref:TolC family protein n=1 Tax=Hydrocarboniphaga sp. TaxID=2033016 RepID=UPI002613BE6C|nr:TolC family protein [Hydrocarboniphaga sp.]MDB5972164.1 hypothetical protein [Hydrocarboniphaga sp.]